MDAVALVVTAKTRYLTLPTVSDSVNRDISTAGGRASLYNWIVYKREYKARERKGEEQQRRSTFYAILESYKLT